MKKSLPAALALVFSVQACSAAARPDFPKHWGNPPRIETQDYGPLPGGYGHGSSTMARWIQQNLDRDAAGGPVPKGTPIGVGVVLQGRAQAGKMITLALEGAGGSEREVTVRFLHRSGQPTATVKAERSKADGGWQARFTPERSGVWIYRVKATSTAGGESPPLHGRSGTFTVTE